MKTVELLTLRHPRLAKHQKLRFITRLRPRPGFQKQKCTFGGDRDWDRDRDRGPGPGSSYSMDKQFLILLLSNSPPLTSGLQPSGRGQQTPNWVSSQTGLQPKKSSRWLSSHTIGETPLSRRKRSTRNNVRTGSSSDVSR